MSVGEASSSLFSNYNASTLDGSVCRTIPNPPSITTPVAVVSSSPSPPSSLSRQRNCRPNCRLGCLRPAWLHQSPIWMKILVIISTMVLVFAIVFLVIIGITYPSVKKMGSDSTAAYAAASDDNISQGESSGGGDGGGETEEMIIVVKTSSPTIQASFFVDRRVPTASPTISLDASEIYSANPVLTIIPTTPSLSKLSTRPSSSSEVTSTAPPTISITSSPSFDYGTTIGPSSRPTSPRPTKTPTFSPSTTGSSSPSEHASELPTTTVSLSLLLTPEPTMSTTSLPTTASHASLYPTTVLSSFLTSDFPTKTPPTVKQSHHPTDTPTLIRTPAPTNVPTPMYSQHPTAIPTPTRSQFPTVLPTLAPSHHPTSVPSVTRSRYPTGAPTPTHSQDPTRSPTLTPSQYPTRAPTLTHSQAPTVIPTLSPSKYHSSLPSVSASIRPSSTFSFLPTASLTDMPSRHPTARPSEHPTTLPTDTPSRHPTARPSEYPTTIPSEHHTFIPSQNPTTIPTTPQPSSSPPTISPTTLPSEKPTLSPTFSPTLSPTKHPSQYPSTVPSTAFPSQYPTPTPTSAPTRNTVSFAVMGGAHTKATLRNSFSKMEKTEFVLHLGDFLDDDTVVVNNGDNDMTCDENTYRAFARFLARRSPVPVFCTPGGNEWGSSSVCPYPPLAAQYWKTHFVDLEKQWSSSSTTETNDERQNVDAGDGADAAAAQGTITAAFRQSKYEENVAFRHENVLFVGVRTVAGGGGNRAPSDELLDADSWWVKLQLYLNRGSIRALVVFGHDGVSGENFKFFSALSDDVASAGVPAVYIHLDGDGGAGGIIEGDRVQGLAFRRVAVRGGDDDRPFVMVTVDPSSDDPFTFS
eukprot:CAMPEP_0172490178 /NCGR_PEP_ID=MMETSP1066-20121228/20498_1 /TAXON_ID=671091 /ORGANISM="Coscinodiscus wailesii, Strain CCMP2513" /LENGTH=861 /DNA_ID=CAMNT_0013258509 /DNA_START=94 /DNA_END=2679 /DNA_ORIENTATION=-